jgi:uncharacterized protein (DUF433 family)
MMPSRCAEIGQAEEVMGRVRHERIVSDPEVMLGRPCIKGTRIPVELLLEKLGEGASVEELLEAYPHLERADVLAALRFAADYLADEDIVFAGDAAA